LPRVVCAGHRSTHVGSAEPADGIEKWLTKDRQKLVVVRVGVNNWMLYLRTNLSNKIS
jgi:hypothetical protein